MAIRLCYDVLRCRPAVVSTDTNTPASSTIRPRAADTPQSKGVGARGTPRSGAGASPATPGHATSTATQPPTTNTDNASTTLGDWALQLLSSTGAAVKSGSAGTHMSTNTGLGTAAAAALTAEQRQLLCMAAVGRLAGQTLLAGNIITLPLLGYTLVWYVEGLVGGIVGGNGHQLRTWGRVEVGTTNVELLLQGANMIEKTQPLLRACGMPELGYHLMRSSTSCCFLACEAPVCQWASVKDGAEPEFSGFWLAACRRGEHTRGPFRPCC